MVRPEVEDLLTRTEAASARADGADLAGLHLWGVLETNEVRLGLRSGISLDVFDLPPDLASLELTDEEQHYIALRVVRWVIEGPVVRETALTYLSHVDPIHSVKPAREVLERYARDLSEPQLRPLLDTLEYGLARSNAEVEDERSVRIRASLSAADLEQPLSWLADDWRKLAERADRLTGVAREVLPGPEQPAEPVEGSNREEARRSLHAMGRPTARCPRASEDRVGALGHHGTRTRGVHP